MAPLPRLQRLAVDGSSQPGTNCRAESDSNPRKDARAAPASIGQRGPRRRLKLSLSRLTLAHSDHR